MSSAVDDRSAAGRLDEVFGALAHPIRRDMVERLRGGTLSVGELAEPYAISGPAVSQHLTVLERAGLIERTVRRQWRDCALTADGLTDAADWIDRHRTAWDERLDRLERHLAARALPHRPTDEPTETT